MLRDIANLQTKPELSHVAFMLWSWMVRKNYNGSLRKLQKKTPPYYRYKTSAQRVEIRDELIRLGYVEEYEVVVPKRDMVGGYAHTSKRIRVIQTSVRTPEFGFTQRI